MLNNSELNQLFQYAVALSNDNNLAKQLLKQACVHSQKLRLASNQVFHIRKLIRSEFMRACFKNNQVAFPLPGATSPVAISTQLLAKQQLASDEFSILYQSLTSSEREILFLSTVLELSMDEIRIELNISKNFLLMHTQQIINKSKNMDSSLQTFRESLNEQAH